MAKRTELTAVVSASHPETGYPAEYAEIRDVQDTLHPGKKATATRRGDFSRVEIEVRMTAEQVSKTMTVDDAGLVKVSA